ncbi:hypothetical protein M3090_07325 [Bacteroides sp. ET71]|uniref:hypothetical protein n=1 Tax=Bacteroides sp. ET71 TaxID=2939421 RepID=UPI002011D4CC|nr:hypothetical protein [Bacteroides sp. ET71]MCL1616203.1 hypothetical protein [Bacteroides sp. ET71]
MKTKKLEKQTLTWLVFSANVIVGAMARQMVLHHGLDAFNGYVAFMICTLMLTAIYINLQELFKKTLSPFFETLFIKFPNYGKKGKVEIEDKETTEEESWTKETDTNPPLSMDYAQIRLSAMKAKEQAEQEKLTTVLTYTRESFAPYMKEEDLNILCEYICLFHADKDIPKVVRTVKVDSAIRTIDLMHFGWNIGYQFSKSGIQIATFIKRVFAEALKESEISTLKSKLRLDGKCTIKIDTTLKQSA